MTRAVAAIFVKTPELSPVKTRLARSIGIERALQFYDYAYTATFEILRESSLLCEVVWAVAEADGISSHRWSQARVIYQGDGELGKRLHRVYNELRSEYDQVLLLGSDAPQISNNEIQNALLFLRDSQPIAIGPAEDGGFYLFAGAQDIEESVWTRVIYSQATTLSQLLGNLKVDQRVCILPYLRDVDQLADLMALHRKLVLNVDKLRPEQKKLMAWLDTWLPYHQDFLF